MAVPPPIDPWQLDEQEFPVNAGNVLQFADECYRQEVAQLIGQGALGTSWLISKLGELAHTHPNRGKAESQRD